MIDIRGSWAAGRYRFMQRYRSGMEHNRGEEFDAPFARIDLAGDRRLFYLLWLMAVEADAFAADEPEPIPGIGPMTGALEAFAEFFVIDPDLVQAAAERDAAASSGAVPSNAARRIIATMLDHEKTCPLVRLFDGDRQAAAELRAMVRTHLGPETEISVAAPRTVAELRARARAIRLARERAEANKTAEERRRQAEAAENARQARLETLRRRGESVWREVEGEIERRNAAGYDKATALLSDLRALAEKQNVVDEFRRRLQAIRERHVRKERFIERLAAIG